MRLRKSYYLPAKFFLMQDIPRQTNQTNCEKKIPYLLARCMFLVVFVVVVIIIVIVSVLIFQSRRKPLICWLEPTIKL